MAMAMAIATNALATAMVHGIAIAMAMGHGHGHGHGQCHGHGHGMANAMAMAVDMAIDMDMSIWQKPLTWRWRWPWPWQWAMDMALGIGYLASCATRGGVAPWRVDREHPEAPLVPMIQLIIQRSSPGEARHLGYDDPVRSWPPPPIHTIPNLKGLMHLSYTATNTRRVICGLATA